MTRSTARRRMQSALKASSQPDFSKGSAVLRRGGANCPPRTVRRPDRRPGPARPAGAGRPPGLARFISRARGLCAVGHAYVAAGSIPAGRTASPRAARSGHLATARSEGLGHRTGGYGAGARPLPDDTGLGWGTPARGLCREIAPLIGRNLYGAFSVKGILSQASSLPGKDDDFNACRSPFAA